MKNTSISESQDLEVAASEVNEMQPEYTFDYQKARPNHYAEQIEERGLLVVLDPDIAQVFTTSDAVNQVLRAIIQSMPPAPQHS